MSGKVKAVTTTPTKQGYSEATLRHNIAVLVNEGFKQAAAVAAALAMARKAYRKRFPTGQFPDYLKPQKAPVKQAAKKSPAKVGYLDNPSKAPRAKQMANAMDLYRRFSGHEPELVGRTKKPTIDDVGIIIGEMDGVSYETVRDGEKLKYFHKFDKKSRPLLVSSHDGKSIYIVGGQYNFTEDGIVDK